MTVWCPVDNDRAFMTVDRLPCVTQIGMRPAPERRQDLMPLMPKPDRRRTFDRRFRTRAGRRPQDPTPPVYCHSCGSDQTAVVFVGRGVRTLQCQVCAYTWFATSRKT
jgi:hypothetical protein